MQKPQALAIEQALDNSVAWRASIHLANPGTGCSRSRRSPVCQWSICHRLSSHKDSQIHMTQQAGAISLHADQCFHFQLDWQNGIYFLNNKYFWGIKWWLQAERIFAGAFLSDVVREVRLFISFTQFIPITLHKAPACTSLGFLLSSVAVT